jgi:predicted porin
MLSPLLYSLFTHDCVAGPNSNDDETVYREEVRDQVVLCQDINFSKTMELIVDYRKQKTKH